MTSERSPLTLDTIVDRTYSDPALEGLLSLASLDHVIPPDGHVIPPVGHVIPPDGHVIPPDDHVILSDGEHSTHSSDSSLLVITS